FLATRAILPQDRIRLRSTALRHRPTAPPAAQQYRHCPPVAWAIQERTSASDVTLRSHQCCWHRPLGRWERRGEISFAIPVSETGTFPLRRIGNLANGSAPS